MLVLYWNALYSLVSYPVYMCVSFLTMYHREGLAMRPGLGRVLARLDEPEGDEPRVSRLGSNSSISSTSSCSSTSWSRMHLTEYWPNTQSYKKTETREKKCLKRRDPFENKTRVELLVSVPAFLSVSHSTYQLLPQLTRCRRLVNRAPSPQGFSQSP